MDDLVKQLSDLLRAQGKSLVSAESCTGGAIASNMTRLSGSSEVFERGYVTYSNAAKCECLGVSVDSLRDFGAVSAETAKEMLLGALDHSCADIGVSVTGVAGPGGGSDDKPVGLVYFGFGQKGGAPKIIEKHFSGDRNAVQNQAVEFSFQTLIEILHD